MPKGSRDTRISRRQALRVGAVVGAAGAGAAVALAAGGSSPAHGQAEEGAWRGMHLELDFVVDPAKSVSITQAGSGPPQTGDWFTVLGKTYDVGNTGGAQTGVYQCMGSWTAAAADTGAPDQRFTTVQFRLNGRGAIMGLINEAGANADNLVGAVQGGTGEFAGALGSFRQITLTGTVPGVTGSSLGVRAVFDLILPNVGPSLLPRNR
jgi:hypothetical protein